MKSLLASCCFMSILCAKDPALVVSRPLGETLDRKVQIQVDNLKPFQKIKIEATANAYKEDLWSSVAYFEADAEGKVDLAQTEP
jgi:hypothetical protein